MMISILWQVVPYPGFVNPEKGSPIDDLAMVVVKLEARDTVWRTRVIGMSKHPL